MNFIGAGDLENIINAGFDGKSVREVMKSVKVSKTTITKYLRLGRLASFQERGYFTQKVGRPGFVREKKSTKVPESWNVPELERAEKIIWEKFCDTPGQLVAVQKRIADYTHQEMIGYLKDLINEPMIDRNLIPTLQEALDLLEGKKSER
jgi:hypothetical protein